MLMLDEEYRGFEVSVSSQHVLGTAFPLFAEVTTRGPRLVELLNKPSGDLVPGRTPQEAIENAKRYIDDLIDRRQ